MYSLSPLLLRFKLETCFGRDLSLGTWQLVVQLRMESNERCELVRYKA